jgi:hypothetical protein
VLSRRRRAHARSKDLAPRPLSTCRRCLPSSTRSYLPPFHCSTRSTIADASAVVGCAPCFHLHLKVVDGDCRLKPTLANHFILGFINPSLPRNTQSILTRALRPRPDEGALSSCPDLTSHYSFKHIHVRISAGDGTERSNRKRSMS